METGAEHASPLRLGARASLTRTIMDEEVQAFARLTGDTNPLHLDDAFAKTTRFGRRVVHGFLAAGLISAVLGTQLPGPGAIYIEQRLRFLKPIFPGDTVTAQVEVTGYQPEKGIVTVSTGCFNQRGEQVLGGEAVLLIA
ncbi:MAG: MaoC family dehydratase [Anaerolineales bacterium]|nr:MaoC family dehydratase [Anaerolineales bacterium]